MNLKWRKKDGTYINMLSKKEFSNEYLRNAYKRASLMYLRLHLEFCNENYKRSKIYSKLYQVLRKLEALAIARKIELDTTIQLINNDRTFYWKERKVIIYVS